MSDHETLVLGAGFCGLGAGIGSGALVLEAGDRAGGVCHSYHMTEDGRRLAGACPDADATFRFEPAGGHWLFGARADTLQRLSRYGRFLRMERRAAVFLPDTLGWVPYPLQEHLHCLPAPMRRRALDELDHPEGPRRAEGLTFKDWLQRHFGPTLCELFFFPFNRRYTAGLYDRIAPQDAYKTPIDMERVRRGAERALNAAGYNPTFHHAIDGLDRLVSAMSAECRLQLGRRVTAIDTHARVLHLDNARSLRFGRLVSTVPLDRVLALCGAKGLPAPDPATAVLVVNIGAIKGPACPEQHWVYLPQARSGMHRVGLYSQVDAGYLPRRHRTHGDVVALYAECAFVAGARPDAGQTAALTRAVVDELRAWGFIGEPLVVDTTWTDPAYTWSLPGSRWRELALRWLAQRNILALGRYGGWRFQGMCESFEQGVAALPEAPRRNHRDALSKENMHGPVT